MTSDQQGLSQIKEAVQALPQGKRKAKKKRSATLPAITEVPAEVAEEEEEEEDI